jgi:colicin import membrane protein
VTANDLIRRLRERKGTALSVLLHVLVLGWGLFSFSSRSMEAPPEDVIPVDISVDNTTKMTAGIKSGKKENIKPLVEKVAEAQPIEDAVGKIDKKEVVTDTSAPETPKLEKPLDKKPDPKPEPKKDEAKKAEKKPDDKGDDPIAAALKADKKQPKTEAKSAPPEPTKPKERPFDKSKIAALLDKRDPSRLAATGDAVNPNAALGTRTGNANAMVSSWMAAFVSKVRDCFHPPYDGPDANQFEVDIDLQMRPDGTLAAEPVTVAIRGPNRSVAMAVADAAKRAVVQCQSYTFLPKNQYDSWKYIPMTFGLKDMM